MLRIDLGGKRALVAGVADDAGFGFAIAKKLAEAGASVCVGTWPPAYAIFMKLLERGKIDNSMKLADGRQLEFERIYAFDGDFDDIDQVPAEIRENRRYKGHADFSIQGVANQIVADFGPQSLDIVVHSIANAPEVKRPLLETSRKGYLSAINTSSFSFVAMVQRFAPIMRPGGSFQCLSFMAGERVIPGYGGGMSTAKAALESDTRVLAYEAGRGYDVRVNCISAGPWASRAASAIGFIEKMIEYGRRNSPIPQSIHADDVGNASVFLASPLAAAITGTTLYVDHGYHAMGMAVDRVDELYG